MAITGGTNLNKTPSPTKAALVTNYLDLRLSSNVFGLIVKIKRPRSSNNVNY